MTRACPQCPDTDLVEKPWALEYSYRGQTMKHEVRGGACPGCGYEDLSPEEQRRFDLAKQQFHDQVDRALNYGAFPD